MLAACLFSLGLGLGLLGQPATAPSSEGQQLDRPAVDAMLALLDKERQSLASYEAILKEHRPIPPFARIVRDEATHEQKLLAEMKRFGIGLPPNSWADRKIAVPAEPDAARQLGVTLEKETVEAYTAAIAAVADEELKSTLRQLRTESRQHQRMFERCCGMGEGPGAGPGAGAGRGAGPGPGPGAARR